MEPQPQFSQINPEPGPEKGPKKGFADEIASFIWETVKIVAVSLAIILPIRYYLIQPFFVKGQSMVPNFQDKDYVLVDKLGYRLNKPERGDVIVFRYPRDPNEYFIKRIIGLPEESVEIRANRVYVYNRRYPGGFVLDETGYLPNFPEPMQNIARTALGPNEFFVMGDNRPHSSDSRAWGGLDFGFVSGRAWVRLWPLDQILAIPGVAYPTPSPL